MTEAREDLGFFSSGRIALRSPEDARAELKSLYGVYGLSALMFDGRDANSIPRLAADAVSSLGDFLPEATYRIAKGKLVGARCPERILDGRMDALVAANLGTDQQIELADGQCRYAIALQAVEATKGELRLRRDLVEDLPVGTEDESACQRAGAIGHNLRVSHTVTILDWQRGSGGDEISHAARKCAASARMNALVVRRPAITILLTDGAPGPSSLYRAISTEVRSREESIGIGSAAANPSDLPRSSAEAQRALQVQRESISPYGARRFKDLCMYRILDRASDRPEVNDFVAELAGSAAELRPQEKCRSGRNAHPLPGLRR